MRGHGKIDQNRTKFHLNGHNFLKFSHSISIKITFWESSHLYLSSDISFSWFHGGPNFLNVSVMTSYHNCAKFHLAAMNGS